jgi:hypothetical protein
MYKISLIAPNSSGSGKLGHATKKKLSEELAFRQLITKAPLKIDGKS